MRWFAIASLLISAMAVSEGHWFSYWHPFRGRWCFFGRCYDFERGVEKDSVTPAPTRVACSNDLECKSVYTDGFCDRYLKHCKECIELDCLCRRDETCCKGRVCQWGRCREPKKPGTEGSQCKFDVDCNDGLCCAQHYGRMICKKRGTVGQTCYEPEGGLGYSLHHQCPCAQGLKCQTYRYRSWIHAFLFGVHRQCVTKPTAESTTTEPTTAVPIIPSESTTTEPTTAVPIIPAEPTTAVPIIPIASGDPEEPKEDPTESQDTITISPNDEGGLEQNRKSSNEGNDVKQKERGKGKRKSG